MTAEPYSPTGRGGYRMFLKSRTPTGQASRWLSTSKLNESEPLPSSHNTTPGNTNSQPQAQSSSDLQRYFTTYDSSDDDLLIPLEISALTKALLGDESIKPVPKYHMPAERPESSPKPASPALSQSHGRSPALRSKIVRITRTPGRGSFQTELRRSISVSTPETRFESSRTSAEGEEHHKAHAETDVWRPKQDEDQTGANRQGSRERITPYAPGSSRRRIRSEGSPAVTSQAPGADVHTGTPTSPADKERADAIASTGIASRDGSSGKRRDVELRDITRPRRVISVSGSLLGGPARRARRRQIEEEEEDAQAHSEVLNLTAQDPEIRSAAMSQNATDPSSSKLPNSPTTGKRVSLARLSDNNDQRAARHNDTPHQKPISTLDVPLVQDEEAQASAPVSIKQASTRALNEEVGKSQEPFGQDKGPVAQPSQMPSDRRAVEVVSQSIPPSSLHSHKKPAVETAAATLSIKKKQYFIKVNGRPYARMDCIGRGGSGKVYRVGTANGTMLALKRVSLAHMDEVSEKGLMREIELLQRLRSVERVIQLIDHELNREKQMLSLLMEVGQVDFHSLLKNRQGETTRSFDITFVRYYWREMLECVQAIHAHAVVHSDLKPANFVLVRGRLKLIDFGIANAIQTDVTINVHRENMAGTIDYMSPESMMDSNHYAFTLMQNGLPYIPANGAPRVVKVGKPSDVWSLGCILYQMVYGMPPFRKLGEARNRVQAILDWSHHIDIPATTEDGSRVPFALLQTMRRCLSRDQKDRPTCEMLLSRADDFLYPQEYNAAFSVSEDSQHLPMTEELLQRVIRSIETRCEGGVPLDDKALAAWTDAYWAGLEEETRTLCCGGAG